MLLFPSLVLISHFVLPWWTSLILLIFFSLTITILKCLFQVGILTSIYFSIMTHWSSPFSNPEAHIGFLSNGFASPILKSDQPLVIQCTEISHHLRPILLEQNLLCKAGTIIVQMPVLYTLGGSYELQTSLENLIQGL